MLDIKVTTCQLFDVNLANSNTSQNNALILSGCKVKLNAVPYSELDELTYYYLNNNDFGYGIIKIELNFENTFINPYFDFYIQCVSIRADNKTICKIDKNPSSISNKHNYTKLNKWNKLSLGVRYNFRSIDERDDILNCSSFCIEGFVALKNKTSVYGFMCHVQKIDNEWYLIDGNTYKPYKNVHINSLHH